MTLMTKLCLKGTLIQVLVVLNCEIVNLNAKDWEHGSNLHGRIQSSTPNKYKDCRNFPYNIYTNTSFSLGLTSVLFYTTGNLKGIPADAP